MRRFILSFLSLLSVTLMYAQSGEISGTVVDATGESIIGATVMEKGTSNGTVTDFDGNFKIKVEAGKTLVFSYIGFQTQELAAQDGMKVVMQDDALALNEVVVTGYTTQRKADLTGASRCSRMLPRHLSTVLVLPMVSLSLLPRKVRTVRSR